MSKLSFRARALDASKPMPVFCSEDIPDLPDFAAINRAVPQMPTGMEKEEECEHHLQRAISAQQAYGKTGDLVIPTPEVYSCSNAYETLYLSDYKQPRQLIHMQPFAMEQDIPDYDMDSEDERWVNQQAKKMELNSTQFEEMMDRLEKGSGQQVVTLKEAKLLLKEDDDLIIAVYDYWLNKRLRTQHPLIPQVKTEKRDGSTNNNPYVAFRRRTEKMQTRKNRKNDETSYEKMLKLRRDLSRAVTVLEMVKRREKTKREHLHLSIEVFEKRYQAGDFTGQLLQEVTAMRPAKTSFMPVLHSQFPLQRQDSWSNKTTKEPQKKKREYKRRKLKTQPNGHVQMPSSLLQQYNDLDIFYRAPVSSEEEGFSAGASDQEDENDPDGPFSFRRKKWCQYQSPLETSGNWPWCDPDEGGSRISHSDSRYKFCLTSLHRPRTTCIGFARRRIGRGGRVVLDRAYTPLDDHWSEMYENQDTSGDEAAATVASANSRLFEGMEDWPHFWPKLTTSQKESNVDLSDRILPELASNNQTFATKSNDSVVLNQTLLTCGLENLVASGGVIEDGNVVPIELTIESFQSHQEELLKMQRKQREKSSADTPVDSVTPVISEHSSGQCSQTFANLLLDSASAKFAVSALVSATTKTQNSTPSTVTLGTSGASSPGMKNVHTAALISRKPTVLNGPSLNSGLSLDVSKATIVNSRIVNSVSSSLSSSSSSPTTNCHDNNRKQLSSLLVDAPASSTIMTSASSLSLSSLLSSQPSVPSSHNSNTVAGASNLSSLLASNNSTPVSILATRALTPKSTPDLKFTADTPIGSAASALTENHDEKAHIKVDGLVSENALPTEVT